MYRPHCVWSVLTTSVKILPYRPLARLIRAKYFNLLLTEREGRTGEYWPEVVIVRTEHRAVRTKTTEGRQYSPVRLEQARLVSSLLYGTLAAHALYFSFKRTSVQLNSKDLRRVMTRATQKEQATTPLKKNY